MVFVDNVLLGPAPIQRSSAGNDTESRSDLKPGNDLVPPEIGELAGTFRLEIPVALFGDAAVHQVRFFVFSNGSAVELHPPESPGSAG